MILLLALLLQDPPEKLAEKCGSQIEWFTDGAVIRDKDFARRSDRVDTIPVFDKAKARAAETKRLILWYIPRVTGPHMYRPALPDGYARVVFFTDPEIVELVRRKFVPMRVVADRAMAEATGVKRFDVVEPAIAILAPDGKVVHTIDRIRTYNAAWLLDVLVTVLRANPEFNATEKNAKVEDLVLGGDYEKAAEKKPDAYWTAVIARRQRKGDQALKSLQGVRSADASVEKGRILLAQGKIAEARTTLEAVPRRSDALYFVALCDYWSGDEKKAEEGWRALIRRDADSPWAWRAAANVARDQDTLAKGPALHGFEDPFWAPGAAHGAARGTRWSRTPADADDIARRGVEFLLRAQRSDGGWEDARYSYWPDIKLLPNVWISASAAAATALLEWRDVAPDRVDKALARAEKYFLDDARVARGQNEECYAEAFKILYLVRKQARFPKKGILESIAAVSKRLAPIQDRGGFWAHEYPNPFCTAAVAHCLQLARGAGAKLDESMLDKAADAIASTRGDDGAQAYDSGRKASPMKDSMARVVQCEHALVEAGKLKPEAVAAALENYWKFQTNLETIRVCDFHSDGELGGFFFFHSLFFTSEAVKALPEKDRKAHFDRLAEWVCSIGELDGSFLDSHELGKSYGTAMALLVLRNARP